ncbi:MAG: ABC transporter substrate-binding protein [Actinomycetota bacterium]
MRAAERTIRVAGSPLLALALLGAACSGGGDGDPSSTTSRASGEVVDGGTVRLGLASQMQPDPVLVDLSSPAEMLVIDLLHDGLTALGDDGRPVPALAAEWEPDEALKTWTFELDPDATFASGRQVTAEDVVASLERMAKGGDSSLPALRLETISGFRAFVDGTAEHLAGLTAPDASTVKVALDSPLGVLPVILASPLYGVVDVGSLDEASAGGARLADLDLSGGWAVESAEDDAIMLERREGTPGHLDMVELSAYEGAEAAYDAFDEGDVDWALVPVERYADAVEEHGDDAFSPFHAELFFGMRVTAGPLANIELRKAIAASIDRQAIVEAVYPDLAAPLDAVVPDGVTGHDPNPCDECGHDPERAKSLVAAAFPDGNVPSVAIDFDESAAQEAMAAILAKGLQDAGIPSELRPKPLEEYKRFVVSGAQQLFSFGWIGVYDSPDAYLAPLFGSAADDNLTGFGLESVDAALAAARASTDAPAAARHWGNVERRVLADAVVVPIAQFRTQAVLGERVQGFAHAVDGSVDWSTVWVSDGA